MNTYSGMARRSCRVVTLLVLAISVILTASGCAADQIDSRTGHSQVNASSEADATVPASSDGSGTPEAATAMAASKPLRLEIPSLGVDTPIIDLALNSDGTLEVPPDGTSAGWYIGAPTPGEIGPAIIAGHVDWHGADGVFFDLRNLQPGAAIIVSREDGSRAVFSATAIEQFPKNEFPSATVYGDIDYPGLRMITCGGSFDENASSYTDNVIAFASLDQS